MDFFPQIFDKLPTDVRVIWYLRCFCDGCEDLMELVFIHRFEVSVVRRPQDGVCGVLPNDLGDPL